jgi:DNA polymerase I-like protein with 3'-5' exonuclease and polymerase domains
MREAYRSGEDLHRVTASLVTGKAPEDVTKGERQLAKAINFGIVYAMGARGLQRYAQSTFGAAMTGGEAEHFAPRFFRRLFGMPLHRKEAENPSAEFEPSREGLRRIPPGEGLPGPLNTPVQVTQRTFSGGLGRLPAALFRNEARIVASVHDEILLEVPERHATAAAEILSRTRRTREPAFLHPFPVVAEAWGGKLGEK